MTGLELVLLPAVSGIVGIIAGKTWGKVGTVTMERCELLHSSVDEKLGSIDAKIDKLMADKENKHDTR